MPEPCEENPQGAVEGWKQRHKWQPDEESDGKTCHWTGEMLIVIGETTKKKLPVYASSADNGTIIVEEKEGKTTKREVGLLQTHYWNNPPQDIPQGD